jgi:hypothetical protein
MMTEREAWGRLIEGAKRGEFLCNMLRRMLYASEISEGVYRRMKAPIEKLQRRRNSPLGEALGVAVWDDDREGRRNRVRFCRRRLGRLG